MSDTDETINQALRRFIVDNHLDVDVAVDKTLAAVSRAKLAAFVRPIVMTEARRVARHVTRRIEDAAFSHPPTVHATTPRSVPSGGGESRITTAEARQLLVAAQFVTPDGRWVTWGTATAEDHLARAEWQRGHAQACVTDADRHEYAAHLIAANNVTCLDEIDGWEPMLDRAAA